MRLARLMVALVLLLAVAACGGDDDDDGTAAPEGTTTTTTIDEAEAAMTALEVVEAELAAETAGDVDAIVALWAPEAPIYDLQPGFEWIEDFDGDGRATMMDLHTSQAAIGPATGKQIAVDCTEVSTGVVECTNTLSTAFSDAAGAEPAALVLRLTVEDGLITDQEVLGPEDPAVWGPFEEANVQGWSDYRQWVADTYPERLDTVFPAGQPDMSTAPASIDLQIEMLDEFVATLGT